MRTSNDKNSSGKRTKEPEPETGNTRFDIEASTILSILSTYCINWHYLALSVHHRIH